MRKNPQVDQANAASPEPVDEMLSRRAAPPFTFENFDEFT